jgi:hypothetical protein
MQLWTKNGSIPYPDTDGTEGWQPAPDKPEVPEGKELVWIAPEWVVRDPEPANREGYQWAYFLDKGWVELSLFEGVIDTPSALTTEPLSTLATTQII